ncbi:MAG: cytochrome P450 [Proteobacteria bacterium]|nr:cytochrome P450 [Pseudomonadota bacterium]
MQSHELGSTDETIVVLRRAFDELGDLFRIHVPSRGGSTWVASHPDDVKRVLVTNHRNYTKGVGIDRVRLLLGNGIMTSEGEFWRRQRRMMQSAFHRRVVERYASIVREENEALGAEWSAAARSTGGVNVTYSASRLALRVILRALFDDDLRQLVPDLDNNPFAAILQDARRDTRFAYEFRQLARDVKALVEVRRARRQERFDLLQLLLDARDADTGEAMSDAEIVDEVMTLVVAGHETTASTLNWTWWLLATHPAVARRVAEEQRDVGDLGHASYADLIRLPYMRQVVDESMRLYPPGWLLTRRSIGPDTLGGHAVPAGTDVFISPYLVHRHPQHWRLPETFDPRHFDPPQVEARHAFAYIPFAAGPRHCIGQNFSLYEILLHFNYAARRFRLTDPQPVQPFLEARINLRTASDVHMRIQQR